MNINPLFKLKLRPNTINQDLIRKSPATYFNVVHNWGMEMFCDFLKVGIFVEALGRYAILVLARSFFQVPNSFIEITVVHTSKGQCTELWSEIRVRITSCSLNTNEVSFKKIKRNYQAWINFIVFKQYSFLVEEG